MKVIAIKCPQCGGSLKIESDRRSCFCTYCGTQIYIDDGSKTITYRNIDEAKIKEFEIKEKFEFKELELKEKQEIEREKFWRIFLYGWGLSILILLILSFITEDNVNTSPYQLILIIDIIAGVKILKKKF